MMADAPRYDQQLRALEDRLRPRPRFVLPYLLKSTRHGLADAARTAADHADALDRLQPPPEAAAKHRAYVQALRAVARDTGELAEQRGWRTPRRWLEQLRGLPSYREMLDTREVLLNSRPDG